MSETQRSEMAILRTTNTESELNNSVVRVIYFEMLENSKIRKKSTKAKVRFSTFRASVRLTIDFPRSCTFDQFTYLTRTQQSSLVHYAYLKDYRAPYEFIHQKPPFILASVCKRSECRRRKRDKPCISDLARENR